MKMNYINAEMEIVLFDAEDVIATSPVDTGGLNNGGIYDGSTDTGAFDELFPNL